MKMLGKIRAERCKYGCCGPDVADGKRAAVRRAKRRERRKWRKEMFD